MDIPLVRHVRKKRRMDSETAADTGLLLQGEIKREMFEIMDRFTSEIDGRFQRWLPVVLLAVAVIFVFSAETIMRRYACYTLFDVGH